MLRWRRLHFVETWRHIQQFNCLILDQFGINSVTMATVFVFFFCNCNNKRVLNFLQLWFAPLTGFFSKARMTWWTIRRSLKENLNRRWSASCSIFLTGSARWVWVKTAGRFVLSWKHTQLCECGMLLWRQTAGELMGVRLSADIRFFLGGWGSKKTSIKDKEKFSSLLWSYTVAATRGCSVATP